MIKKTLFISLFLSSLGWASYQPVTGSTVSAIVQVGASSVTVSNPLPVQSTGTTTVTGTVTATLSGSINNTGFNVNNVSTVTFNGTAQPVNATILNVATTTISGTPNVYVTNISSVSGTAASGASPTNNPLQDGREAFTSWPTAVSNAQMVAAAGDKMGRTVDVLDCPYDLQISTTVTLTASTSETLLLSSGTTGVYNDLVSVVVSNSGSTASLMTFRNTGFGTTGWIHIFVPATDTRGLTTAHPWLQQASASDWTVQGSASSSSIYVDAVFCQRK